jgi:hypothetical protein
VEVEVNQEEAEQVQKYKKVEQVLEVMAVEMIFLKEMMKIYLKPEKRDLLLNSKMEQFMMENGFLMTEMDPAFKNGLMEPDMKVNGKIIKLMAKENFIMLMEMSLRER